MAWTQPKTWTSEPLTSGDLNTHLRDNMEALKDPPGDSYVADESTNYSTTSTSFVDVDSTNLSFTITTNGGDVLFHGHWTASLTAGFAFYDIEVDGVRVGGDDGIVRHSTGSGSETLSFTRLITGLSAGSHTFKMQWRTTSGTITMYAGAGTSNNDVHPQFWVREVS